MVNTIKRLTLFVLVSLTSLPVGVQAIDSPTAATRNNGSNRGSSSFSSFANNVGDVVKDFGDDVEELLENYSTFAGKIFPILSKFYIPPSKARQIFHEIKKEADLYEWITILVLGFATVPLIKYPYEKVLLTKRTKIGTTDERVKFEDTFVYQLTHHIAGAGKIAVLVYGLDCLIVAIKTMGFTIETKYSQLAAKGIYTTWIFSRLLQWKRYFVTRAVFAMRKGKKEGKENRAKIANQITDVLVFAICGFFLIDLLKVHAGVFLKSFFTLGAAGTGLISFASKDLAMGLISGLALQASDKIFEGDTIRYKNIEGHVDHIGLMETTITDSEEMVMAIPNKDLSQSNLINISRMKFSRVRQDLHFLYEDCQKLPEVLADIKHEIRSSCPFAVIDGSKPLRAYFKNFGDSYLEVEVDVRLKCRPSGEEYKKGRQDILLAIDRVVKRHNMDFAVVKENLIN